MEAAALPWREEVSARTLRRDGRRWSAWTAWIAAAFVVPGALLLWLEPLTAPVAAISFAHGWLIPWIQARRGARSIAPLGEPGRDAERVALGLLGDLLDHRERELLGATGLALQRGTLGTWLLGERGALMVRPGGRRVDCWCVRVAEAGGLPAGDHVAHLLLALREDERAFAKVANLAFSGAPWRVRMCLPERARPALDECRADARRGG